MRLRFLGMTFLALCLATSATLLAAGSGGPGSCPSDSKLLNGGPTSVFGSGPGSWWDLVLDGLDAAGFDTDSERVAYLNGVFDTDFTTLAELKTYNLQLLSDVWDTNQNGYVCAFQLRGKRAYTGDAYINLTTFGVSDDRIAK